MVDVFPPLDIFPRERVVCIIGNYGSGKSEVSVNWALALANAGISPLYIADLDIVNPYFRCREAIEPLEAAGVHVVVPRGGHFYADLPIILPEIKGLFESHEGTAIFDVGGDDAGARVLSSFAGAIPAYEMLQVVNTRRPFTATVEGILTMRARIEESSGLKVTGYIGNTHLMEETELETLTESVSILKALEQASQTAVRFVTAPARLYNAFKDQTRGFPVLPLRRLLQPPWKPEDHPFRPMNKPLFRV
ncbi:cobalamin biosynthesis protein CbiA [Myxococcota bacterium]|nr:cobalamin biosynthesis protein CbiA [Myxococcota bacterium]MBU1410977.1 cobalamin biosynthesis protein CbiA [Myxococcota bacterium]MBU1512295.1 cobalamin biosynthesis protein CbiA [Myxococcota bacterium]